VGSKFGLDRCGKSRPLPGIDPRTVQAVARHYTNYATPWRSQAMNNTKIMSIFFCLTHFQRNFRLCHASSMGRNDSFVPRIYDSMH
jgi:hypothetical protein